MSQDHLDTEISVKGEITESSVELRAKSRLLSGLDRLGGNLSELVNAPMERRAARIRGEARIIEEAAAAAVARIRANPDLADPLIIKQLSSVGRRLTNSSGVMIETLQDLSQHPPTADQAQSGPEELSPEFLDRFERYAEDASTEELRVKWGKVLAAEVRSPGSISRITMRTVDELPSAVAIQFENLCRWRLNNHLLIGLTGELPFEQQKAMAFYGLISDPGGLGHITRLLPSETGDEVWLYIANGRAFGLPRDASWKPAPNSKLMVRHELGPAMPAYMLTDVGVELASIFGRSEDAAWGELINRLIAEAKLAGGYKIRVYQGPPHNLSRVSEIDVGD